MARVCADLGEAGWEEYRRAGQTLPIPQAIAIVKTRDVEVAE